MDDGPTEAQHDWVTASLDIDPRDYPAQTADPSTADPPTADPSTADPSTASQAGASSSPPASDPPAVSDAAVPLAQQPDGGAAPTGPASGADQVAGPQPDPGSNPADPIQTPIQSFDQTTPPSLALAEPGRPDQTQPPGDNVALPASQDGALPADSTHMFFDRDQAVLTASDMAALDAYAAAVVAGGTTFPMTVTGYASMEGPSGHNKDLAWDRANAVKAYLVGKGVPEIDIAVNGAGATSAFSPDDLRQNRRVELDPKPPQPPSTPPPQPPTPTPPQDDPPLPPPDPGQCDPLTPSSNWSITTVASLSGGAGVTVGGIACILKDLSPYGCEHHISFAGVGFGGGAKVGGKSAPFTISVPSSTAFTTEIPVTVGDFNGGGRVMTADIGVGGVGRGVARGQFSAFKTSPEWLDLGGYEAGFGASMNIWVGKWTAPKP